LSELPFLVVHGALIAKIAVAVLFALAFACAYAIRRRGERAATRALVDPRRSEIGELAPAAVVVLRGTLRGAAATLTPSGDAGSWMSYRADDVTIEIEGERVELVGPVEVVRGTSAEVGYRKLPPSTPKPLAERTSTAAYASEPLGWRRLFSVRTGDDVIVRGKLDARSGDSPASYRESAGAWVMEPMAGTSSILLVATTPAVVPPPRGWFAWTLVVAVCGVIAYAIPYVVGASAVDIGSRDGHGAHREQRDIGMALQIAAAMPGSRDKALREIESQVDSDFGWTERRAEMKIGLAGLRYGCDAEARAFVDAARFDDALATATSCGDDDARGIALFQLGRYGEAADAFARLPADYHRAVAEGAAAIAAGRWADAAVQANAVAAQWAHDPSMTATTNRATCLAEWFRVKAGASTVERLRALATAKHGACTIVLAYQFPNELKRELAETLPGDDIGITAAVQFARGESRHDDYRLDMVLRASPFGDNDVWLARFPADIRDPEVPVPLVLEYALAAVLRGDTKAALDAIAAVRVADPSIAGKVALVRALVQLHTAATPIAFPADAYGIELLSLRNGVMPERKAFEHLVLNCNAEVMPAFQRAMDGDGDALASLMEACGNRVYDEFETALLAVLPRVKVHRAELAAAVRALELDWRPRDASHLLGFLIQQLTRRDLLRLAGEDALAARVQQHMDRHLAMLADRDKALALMFWDQ
jgi:hypothetical protein